MTPEEARELLEGITPAPWEFESVTSQKVGCPEVTEFWATGRYDVQIAEQDATEEHRESTEKDFTLIAAAPGMAVMIANMTAEYAVERNCSVIEGEPDWEKIGFGMCPGIIANTFWTTEKKLAEKLYKEAKTGHLPVRIVRRYVTAPQPLPGGEK